MACTPRNRQPNSSSRARNREGGRIIILYRLCTVLVYTCSFNGMVPGLVPGIDTMYFDVSSCTCNVVSTDYLLSRALSEYPWDIKIPGYLLALLYSTSTVIGGH